MNPFPSRPLGSRIPDRLHAVSCSLPTMRDVIGYEEKDVHTIQHVSSGYPRFVVHPLLVAIERAWTTREKLGASALWMVSSRRMADRLATYLAPEKTQILSHDGIWGLAHRDEPGLRKRARSFLQHTGGFLSSREAEDYCARQGVAGAAETEKLFAGDASTHVRRVMQRVHGLDNAEFLLLAPSGMNAFWSAFCAVSNRQRPAGRDLWLQVGWLYLDTGAILAKLTGERTIRILDVLDKTAIEAVFREYGSRLAGVVTEVTTNPLMQTCDLPWLADLARRHGALVLADPSISSAFNVDLIPHADIVLCSLTKYAAAEGDVIAGSVTITPRCPDRAAMRTAVAAELEPVYARDVARLAAQIDGYETLVTALNANARVVVDHLSRRKRGVRKLYWSGQPGSAENYAKLSRGADRIGPVIAFEVEGPVATFFDALPLAKGPSFGMRVSLICPFVYLAHYDLITSDEGRKQLAGAKLPAELLRFSIGEEPVEQIIAALEQGFAAAGF